MTLDELTERVRAKALDKPPLNYVVRFDLKDGGAIRWDGTVDPPAGGPTPEQWHAYIAKNYDNNTLTENSHEFGQLKV